MDIKTALKDYGVGADEVFHEVAKWGCALERRLEVYLVLATFGLYTRELERGGARNTIRVFCRIPSCIAVSVHEST